MLEKLQEIYGEFDESTRKWISENLKNLGEENEANYLRVIQEEHSKRQGKPDIRKLKIILEKITGKKSREFIWAVCLECGCEYDYGLPMCPDCYDRGFECRAKAVKKSEFQPPMKVINYNKQYLNGDKGETVCYKCVHKKQSYCKNYGNPNWNCQREEFESCNCSRCCAIAKRFNAELEKNRNENKVSYAVPLKRGVEND